MTLAVTRSRRMRWRHSAGVRDEPLGEARTTVRPVGASLAAAGAVLVGAWGAVAVYIGPYFGYRPVSRSAWDWNLQNSLLHLAPGALAVIAGLLLLAIRPGRGASRRAALAVPAILLAVAGAWFVVGPVAWPTFESGPAYAPVLDAGRNLLNQAGASLAPGLALAAFAGMALKAALVRPSVHEVVPVPAETGRGDTVDLTETPAVSSHRAD